MTELKIKYMVIQLNTSKFYRSYSFSFETREQAEAELTKLSLLHPERKYKIITKPITNPFLKLPSYNGVY